MQQFEGAITGIAEGGIRGWAWDAAEPYDAVEVELWLGNRLLGRVKADTYDAELSRQRKGDGRHAFVLVPHRLPAIDFPATIFGLIVGSEVYLSGTVLIGSPEELRRLLPTAAPRFSGMVEGIRDGRIVGWVDDAENPDQSVAVTLHDGEVEIGSAMATAGAETLGVRSFELAAPASLLDGAPHRLHVRARESGFELGNSPFEFQAAPPAQPQPVVQADDSVPVSVLVGELQRLRDGIAGVIVERVEAYLTVFRDETEREVQVLRGQVAELERQVSALLAPNPAQPIAALAETEPADARPTRARAPETRAVPMRDTGIPLQLRKPRPRSQPGRS